MFAPIEEGWNPTVRATRLCQNKEVDICVHSMKDVPTLVVPGTVIPCNLPREDTSDAFISGKADSLSALPGERETVA